MRDMEIVTLGELQKNFGVYSDEACIRPVGVSRNGRTRFVMVPVEQYERLVGGERRTRSGDPLDQETMGALRTVEPGKGSIAAEARMNRTT